MVGRLAHGLPQLLMGNRGRAITPVVSSPHGDPPRAANRARVAAVMILGPAPVAPGTRPCHTHGVFNCVGRWSPRGRERRAAPVFGIVQAPTGAAAVRGSSRSSRGTATMPSRAGDRGRCLRRGRLVPGVLAQHGRVDLRAQHGREVALAFEDGYDFLHGA